MKHAFKTLAILAALALTLVAQSDEKKLYEIAPVFNKNMVFSVKEKMKLNVELEFAGETMEHELEIEIKRKCTILDVQKDKLKAKVEFLKTKMDMEFMGMDEQDVDLRGHWAILEIAKGKTAIVEKSPGFPTDATSKGVLDYVKGNFYPFVKPKKKVAVGDEWDVTISDIIPGLDLKDVIEKGKVDAKMKLEKVYVKDGKSMAELSLKYDIVGEEKSNSLDITASGKGNLLYNLTDQRLVKQVLDIDFKGSGVQEEIEINATGKAKASFEVSYESEGDKTAKPEKTDPVKPKDEEENPDEF